MDIEQRAPAPNTGIKHKKRHWIVCEDCHQRKRVAHPGAKYCSKSCAKRAQLRRKKERQEAEQARALEMAASYAKKVHESLEVVEKARQERSAKEALILAENRRKEALKAKEQDRINRTVIQPCECGSEIWIYYPEEKPLLGRVKPARLECNGCGKVTIPGFVPLACPRCQGHWLYINRYGEKKCRGCNHRY